MRFLMNIASLSTKTVLLRWLAIVVRRVRSLSCRAAMALIFTAPVFGHGTYHEMIEELQQEMAQKGEDHALMTRRAFIHVEHEDWKAALADLEQARLELDWTEVRATMPGAVAKSIPALCNFPPSWR